MGTRLSDKPARDWDEDKESLIVEIAGISERLRKKGSTTVFMWLPPGRSLGQNPPTWMVAIAARGASPWWDVGQEADRSLIELTDGSQMAAPSAARTVRTVIQGPATQTHAFHIFLCLISEESIFPMMCLLGSYPHKKHTSLL